MADLQITLDDFDIPMRNVSEFVEITTPNESTNVTIGGIRYTDFVNNLRSWKLKTAYLCDEDYQSIRQIYLDQFNNEAYPLLEVPLLTISAPVKMSISERNIRQDGEMVVEYEILLEEQYAIS
jgi:hypothetical protein